MSNRGPANVQRVDKNLEKALTVQPGIHSISPDYPIELTPHSPYLVGRAALVFVAPHVLNPADDLAEYGWQDFDENYGYSHNPPHEGARVVAWFRPSDATRKYNVDFSCEGQPGHSLVLALNTGDTETVQVSASGYQYPELAGLEKVSVGTTFGAKNHDWKWFSLSSDGHWKLLSFEVFQLPA